MPIHSAILPKGCFPSWSASWTSFERTWPTTPRLQGPATEPGDTGPARFVVPLYEAFDAERALKTAAFADRWYRVPGNEGYSYVYQGNSQVLDHVLASKAAAEGAIIDAVHVNAEFPSTDRASDHDPIVVKLAF